MEVWKGESYSVSGKHKTKITNLKTTKLKMRQKTQCTLRQIIKHTDGGSDRVEKHDGK